MMLASTMYFLQADLEDGDVIDMMVSQVGGSVATTVLYSLQFSASLQTSPCDSYTSVL